MDIDISVPQLLYSIDDWLMLAAIVIAACSAIAALTPTPKDDEFLAKIYHVVDVLALNIMHANTRRLARIGKRPEELAESLAVEAAKTQKYAAKTQQHAAEMQEQANSIGNEIRNMEDNAENMEEKIKHQEHEITDMEVDYKNREQDLRDREDLARQIQDDSIRIYDDLVDREAAVINKNKYREDSK